MNVYDLNLLLLNWSVSLTAISCLNLTLKFHGVCQRGGEVGQHQTDVHRTYAVVYIVYNTQILSIKLHQTQ